MNFLLKLKKKGNYHVVIMMLFLDGLKISNGKLKKMEVTP
jgi:hypothetical protein